MEIVNPRKFTEISLTDEWEVLSHDGWREIKSSNKTVPYEVFRVTTETGRVLECADDHVLIDCGFNEVFAKDSLGLYLHTDTGSELVVSVESLGYSEQMYDLSVEGDNLYYTDGFLSHNTTIVAALLLWQAVFNDAQRIAVLANKTEQSQEILARIKMMYELLPWWMQVGVTRWNELSIGFGNKSSVIGASTRGTSIRGRSMTCVTGDTMVTVMDDSGEVKTVPIRSLYTQENSSNFRKYENISTGTDFHMEGVIDLPELNNPENKYEKAVSRGKGRLIDGGELKGAPKTPDVDNANRNQISSRKVGGLGKMKILSEGGVFRQFDGVKVSKARGIVELYFDNGNYLFTTQDHKLLTSNGYIESKALKVGDTVVGVDGNPVTIEYKCFSDREEYVYDPVNVEDTHNFVSAGVVSKNCVYMDEFAWIDNDTEFYTSVYPTITSGKKTKIIITSTPHGMNQFYKIWSDAEKGKNSYKPYKVHWSEMPGRDDAWAEEQIRNTSQRQFDQEYNLEFLGSSDTLLSPSTLQRLTFEEPIELLGENRDFKIYSNPVQGRSYVLTVDCSEGIGLDYSVISVFDVTETPYKQVAMLRSNVIIPELFSELIFKVGTIYNDAVVVVETNSVGQSVVDDLWDMEYENILWTKEAKTGLKAQDGGKNSKPGVKTTVKTKAIGCMKLKSLIESNQLLVYDFDTVQELSNFVRKGKSFEADKGHTDDIVMTFVIFAWFASQNYFSDWTQNSSKQAIRSSIMQNEDYVPFMFLDDGMESETWILN